MKKCLLILFFLVNCYIYSQQIYFNSRYDFNNDYESIFTILSLDTGYLCVAGYGGILLQYIDLNGELVWQKAYGDSNKYYYVGWSNSLILTIDGGYALAGSIQDTSGDSDGLLVKFDANSDTLWTKIFTWQYFNVFYQCKQTINGEYILIGTKDMWGNGANATWLVKTDSLGNIIWDKTFLGIGGSSVIVTKEGNYFFDGGDRVFKTDSAGNVIWSKPHSPISTLLEAQNGDYIGCYGQYDTTLNGSYPQYTLALIRLDTAGNVIWQKTYGPSRYVTGLVSVFETPETDIVAAGQTANLSGTPYGNGWAEGVIVKVNSNGDSIWYRKYEYSPCEKNSDYLRDIKPTSDGGFIAAGFTVPNSFYCAGDSGQQDMWVIKMDSCGCLTPLCDSVCAGLIVDTVNIEKTENEKKLLAVYPNPNNGKFQISNSQFPISNITIYNVLGEKVFSSTLASSSTFNISHLPSGIYYCVISSEKNFRNEKIVIMK